MIKVFILGMLILFFISSCWIPWLQTVVCKPK